AEHRHRAHPRTQTAVQLRHRGRAPDRSLWSSRRGHPRAQRALHRHAPRAGRGPRARQARHRSRRMSDAKTEGDAAPLPLPTPIAARVVVVDDEPTLRRTIARTLTARGFEVAQCEDGAAALSHVRAHDPDVLLIDLMMPGVGGLEVLREVKALRPDVECVIM